MLLQNTINSGLMSDSNDERYEQELVKQRQETEVRFWEEEEQQQAERRARKEAKVAEKRREEEERCQKEEAKRQMKAEKEQRRQKEVDDTFHQEADRQAAVIQVQRKNWLKKMNLELLVSPLSKEEMNLINLLPLTKRQ